MPRVHTQALHGPASSGRGRDAFGRVVLALWSYVERQNSL